MEVIVVAIVTMGFGFNNNIETMNGNVQIGNRAGIPVITTTPNIDTSNVSITLPNHIFRFLGQKGIIIINFKSTIPSGTTTTLPLVISVNGQSLPLTNTAGVSITVANIINTLTFQAYFDKQLNVIRVISPIS